MYYINWELMWFHSNDYIHLKHMYTDFYLHVNRKGNDYHHHPSVNFTWYHLVTLLNKEKQEPLKNTCELSIASLPSHMSSCYSSNYTSSRRLPSWQDRILKCTLWKFETCSLTLFFFLNATNINAQVFEVKWK